MGVMFEWYEWEMMVWTTESPGAVTLATPAFQMTEIWTMSRRYLMKHLGMALLLFFAAFGVGCAMIGDGGGGGIDNTEPRFINGTFKSEQGKVVVFVNDGSYKFYPNEERVTNQQPEISSKYEIKGNDITLEREDGTPFAEPAKLSEDGSSFTWPDHPGEIFTKQP
jgi:hypothetical protein